MISFGCRRVYCLLVQSRFIMYGRDSDFFELAFLGSRLRIFIGNITANKPEVDDRKD